MRRTRLIEGSLAGLLMSMCPGLCQGQRGVIPSPWDFRADASVSVIQEALEPARAAIEVAGGPRDREVLDAATKCASALYKYLHVYESPARVARFRDASGDSWVFRWPGARCPESTLCLTGLIDTPQSTMLDVQLPSGDLIRILDQSLQWFTAPINMGNMHVYSGSMGTEGSPIALLGGVPGSEWLGGFGVWGVIETAEHGRTMRALLGKRHCYGLYPKDLYFSSRRFTNLSSEARRLGLADLLADVKKELRSHRYAFPATDLETLLSELASREPTTEIVRDVIHTAIWPLDSHSRYRMQLVTDQFLRATDVAKRNLGVLVQEMSTFLGGYQRASVRGRVPSHITQIAEDIFRDFGSRKDDVPIEDLALLFVRDTYFTASALQYLEAKGSNNAAEALRRTAVPPEFDSARDLTVRKISERIKRSSGGQ